MNMHRYFSLLQQEVLTITVLASVHMNQEGLEIDNHPYSDFETSVPSLVLEFIFHTKIKFLLGTKPFFLTISAMVFLPSFLLIFFSPLLSLFPS